VTALSIKAGLAIAALTTVAQWATRMGSGSATPAAVAARDLPDPATTGTLGPRSPKSAIAPKPAVKPVDFDQHGLTSLVTQAQAPAPKPAPSKKR
jgi:hypothetical protein